MLSLIVFCFNILLLVFFKFTYLTEDSLIYFIAIGLQTIAIVLDTCLAKNEFKSIKFQLLAAYFVRLTVLFIDKYAKNIITIPQSGADSEMFYRNSVEYMQSWTHSRGGLFPEVMGTIFRYIGENRIFAQFLMIIISMVCIYLIAKILFELKIDNKTMSECMWIICLFPTFAMLSSIFLREVIVCLFVTISVYFFVSYMKNSNILYVIASFAAVLIGAIFHAGVVALYIGYIIVLIFYSNKEQNYNFNIVGVLIATILGILFLYLSVTQANTFFQKFTGIENIEDISNDNNTAGSSYSQFVGSSTSPLSMVIFTIPRMFFFLFSPVPFQWRNPVDAITFFCSSMFYMVSIYYAIQTIRFSKNKLNKSIIIALLIISFCTTFVFGWGCSNAGTALRHRDKIFSVFAIMFTVGQQEWKKHKKNKTKK